jgi:hypothetical protein
MKINRTELLAQLYEFALGGDGLIVGKPGIGKSYMLRELKKKLLENNVLSFIIKIDNAFDSSDQAITTELKLKGDWLETLSKVKLRNEHKAVLIFDAFDAARDEAIRKGFLSQIKRAKKLLQDKWHVLVSVRTYDASKSIELINLFPLDNYRGDISYCRKIEIEGLSDSELDQVFAASQKLGDFYQGSSRELKEILHIPFFLQLLEMIIGGLSPAELDEVKKIKSETQLLDTFWQRKIINTDNHLAKEQLLAKLTDALVARRALSYSKSELLPVLAKDDLQTFDYLRSENILDEVSLNNSRIAFSHNILFDFAVSLYCLDSDGGKLLRFINEDTTRPFFLRPSFLYFFSSLWYYSPDTFWSLFEILNNDRSKEIQLMVRLILNGVIATEYSNTNDLSPLLNATQTGNDDRIRNLLQSVRFIRPRTLPQDVLLLRLLSARLSLPYIFDFAFLLDRAVKDFPDGEMHNYCGEAARNLLQYVFDRRSSEYKEYLDRIAAQRAIELIAKTYATDLTASRQMLEKILTIINEPGFEIAYFTNLSEYSSYIIPVDPEFVAKVYIAIYNYQEQSQEQTRMGTGVVMNLLSNRKQDFEMCYYRLQKLYPDFIVAAPEIALPLGLQIVNKAVFEDRLIDRSEKSSKFSYEDIPVEMVHDYSSLWGDRFYGNKQMEISLDIINYFESLIEANELGTLYRLLRVYIAEAKVGFLWKQLFKFAAKYPEEMAQRVFPLIVVPALFTASETSFEVRELVDKGVPYLSDEQLAQVENLIFKVYPLDTKPNVIQTALSRIPAERLQTEQAKSFMAGKKQVDNEPGIRSSFSSSVYTNEEWLREQGVDVGTPLFKDLNQLVNQMDAFSNVHLNNEPVYSEYEATLKIAKEAFYKILTAKDVPVELFFTVLNAIAKTVAIASRNMDGLTEEDFAFIKKATLFAFNYTSKFDDDNNENSPARGYSPTPRIEAAEALLNVFCYRKESEVLADLEKAIADKNSVVRFHGIRNLIKLFNVDYPLYRRLLIERLHTESDFFVYSTLMQNVMFKNATLKEDATEVLTIAYTKKELFTYNNSFQDSFSEMLLWALANEVDIARTILFDAYQYPEFCRTILFRMFEKMHPSYPENNYENPDEQTKTKIAVALHYVEQAGKVLEAIPAEGFAAKSKEVEEAFKIIDQVIMRIFFDIDAKTYNRIDFKLPINEVNRGHFYFLVKPIFQKVIAISEAMMGKGFILGHTAHYFMQALNILLHYDPKDILGMLAAITRCSIQGGYTLDSFAIQEVVHITEKLLADHRNLLLENKPFQDLLDILDIYINSGWTNALQLLWQLDEIFK